MNAESFDFYKCQRCGKLITKLDEIASFTPGTKRYGIVCKCGCRKYSPTNMEWYHWFLPRVWKFAAMRIMGTA